MNKYVKIGATAAMLAVALGAFGAHALEDRLTSDLMETYQTGVQYHMFHAVGILLVALFIDRLPRPQMARWAGSLLTAGIVIFSGSLYILALSGIKVFGAITPIGGVAFIAGWICLVLASRPNS